MTNDNDRNLYLLALLHRLLNLPFTLIKGHFVPGVGEPDGDSVRFRADDPIFWLKLEGRRVNLNFEDRTVQTRFEGIDAIEKRAIKPLSTEAKNSMLSLIKYDPDSNPEPEGYILSRITDTNGRPICFAFSGIIDRNDGSDVFLDQPMVRNSINYKQMKAGFGYPLYYNTFFQELREAFNEALISAKSSQNGYWPTDATMTGVTVTNSNSLSTISPIWPKLWRRLEEYLRTHDSLGDFLIWLEQKRERVDILPIMEERGLDDVVNVEGNDVSLTEAPENLRIVSAAGPGRNVQI